MIYTSRNEFWGTGGVMTFKKPLRAGQSGSGRWHLWSNSAWRELDFAEQARFAADRAISFRHELVILDLGCLRLT